MSVEPAVVVQNVAKIYRLYRKPIYRAMDLLGLCPTSDGYYTEHPALVDINLEIPRGQKVAIIGRNGAGKSTLLKIITRTLRPTSGLVEIHGDVSALLQIGTGFHPDFTGRQNVYSGFAHMGITGRRARDLFEEVVEFAELEDYIDQPMKTYSTGMAARLMFSAATVLVPDILVLDEILGVGDAYFSHKSYERMRLLCRENSTTLVLVTHDLYSAMSICERFIWIDRGRVVLDGDSRTTLTAYEASIKEQEEERLRRVNTRALETTGNAFTGVRVRIGSHSGFALPARLALGRLELHYENGDRLVLPVAEGDSAWSLAPEGNLGPVTTVDGKPCRCLETFGSLFHKAEWAVQIPRSEGLETLAVEYLYPGPDSVRIECLSDTGDLLISGELPPTDRWSTNRLERGASVKATQQAFGRYGNARISIEEVTLLDSSGCPCVEVAQGGDVTIRVRLLFRDPSAPRDPTFVVGLHRAGAHHPIRVIEDRLRLPADAVALEVDVVLAPLLVGSATYFVTVSVFEPDYFSTDSTAYFSINPRLYSSAVRAIEFRVKPHRPVDATTFVVHPARIVTRALTSADETRSRGTAPPTP